VTGAGSGIGRAVAIGLLEDGYAVVLAGRRVDKLDDTVRDAGAFGAGALRVPTDVRDPDAVRALFAATREKFGRLDLLVNNAGAFDGGPLHQLSVEAWDKVINTNLRAPFLCTRAALRIMKPQNSGRIINIGSISAQRVRPNSGPYSASKHGLWGLTQVTALEGREYGVTCGAIHPGNVQVERRQASGKIEDDEPMMTAGDIAAVAVLMASLPPHVEMLEAIVLPSRQAYVGRG